MKCDELKTETIVPQGCTLTLQMYPKGEVDAAIEELKEELYNQKWRGDEWAKTANDKDKQIDELKADNRKLKRALWMARAERAFAERRRYCAMAAFENIENDALRIKWCKIQQKCLKKAEEYK